MQGAQDAVEVTLALDIGGTFIKSAVFSDGRLVRKLPQIPSRSNGSADEIGAAIAAAAIVAGCCDDSKCKDEVCVSVDGAVLTRSQIDADVDLVLKAEGENIPADQLEEFKQERFESMLETNARWGEFLAETARKPHFSTRQGE